MLNSINTNASALVALQNLSAIQEQLAQEQTIIATGKKINSPKDNGAVWSIAQTMQSKVVSLDAVKDSLNRGQSTIDVAMSAGQQVSDLLQQMKAKALAASDTSLDSVSREALNTDFKQLRDQINRVVNSADFNGVNMVKSSGTTLYALANDSGSSRLTVKAQDLSLGGTNVTISATASFSTAASASAFIGSLDADIQNVNLAMTHLGTGSNAMASQMKFVGSLQDSLNEGISNLVDADMAVESAKLQALQTKQQLAIQALMIANQSNSVLLQLFR
ncbi:MAG TPA: flagellin [Caulobacteraceae bacterium]|jgi:flagellin